MSASFFEQRTLHRPGERPAPTTDLDSVDQVLNEIERDLSSVEAPPPDAD